jgi:hypothetical protein
MTTDTDTDYSHVARWVRPGAKVGVYSGREYFGVGTVLRITATTVRVRYLNGREESFYIKSPDFITRGGRDYSPTYTLVDPDSDQYAQLAENQRRRNAIYRLKASTAEVAVTTKYSEEITPALLNHAKDIANALKYLGLIKDFTQ